MLTKIQEFFLELQKSDQDTKKRWLALLTSVAMTATVALWAIYLNFTVKTLGEAEQQKSSGFFAVFKTGLRVFSEKTAGELSELMANAKTLLEKTNSVTIQTEEEIKPTTLP